MFWGIAEKHNMLVVMGDANAKVGSRRAKNDKKWMLWAERESYFNCKITDDLKAEKQALREKINDLKQKEAANAVKFVWMLNKIANLVTTRDELQQYQRKYNLKTHGIREKEEEDLESLIMQLGEKLDVKI